MKKVASILIAICMCLTFVLPRPVLAEDIEGFDEKRRALLLEENFSTEQIAEMNDQYTTYYSEVILNEYLPEKKALFRMETDSMEEEYELEMNEATLNYSNGLKVSLLYYDSYPEYYAENGVFKYLFSDEAYWCVNRYVIGMPGLFTLDGTYFPSVTELDTKSYGIILVDEAAEFVKDGEEIRRMLLEKGETKVKDMKIFAAPNKSGLSFLYIEGEETEYLIKLYDSVGTSAKYIPETECYRLYTAVEMMKAYTQNSPTIGTEKPTFDAEAEALQAEGLLYGNENGLDLLKPLTRIEAAAMLLRAIGEPETAEGSAQVFSDVPDTHWGFGAAANAYALGLIRGVGDDQFAPDDLVTSTEFATMVLRAADTGEFDWLEAVNLLIEQGIITAEDAETMDLFTRGDMAKIIYEARAKGLLQ